MTYQPPAGARDLLPLDVIQKQWIETRLLATFAAWGYHRLETSTLERVESLMAGGAVRRDTVIQIYDSENDDLGLRPELTASIARAAITRLAEIAHPQRLCYCANVFRKPAKGSTNRQQEFFQAGVELLGASGPAADAEMILLLVDCLERLGIPDWHILVGEADLTRSLLDPFPAEQREPVRRAIARLDRVALETMPLAAALRSRAIDLLELRGQPETVLARLSEWDLNPGQRATLNRLKTLLELVAEASPAPLPIVLDLSLVQTFDYYTGPILEAIASPATGHDLLAQGGRYDRLLGLYHPEGKSYPSVGFCLNLEPLQRALAATGVLPTQIPPTDCLVVPRGPAARGAAFATARQLRSQALEAGQPSRVEMEIKEEVTWEAVRDRARSRGIGRIVWVEANGQVEVEVL